MSRSYVTPLVDSARCAEGNIVIGTCKRSQSETQRLRYVSRILNNYKAAIKQHERNSSVNTHRNTVKQ